MGLVMKKKNREKVKDVEECRDKINEILKEYNCTLLSSDEWHSVIIRDNDTNDETGGFI